jgi:protein arginine N-methyltransferase 1
MNLPPLAPDTILQRVPDIELRLDASNAVTVRTGGQLIKMGLQGLAVLDIYARPTSFADAMDKLKARGLQDWVALTSAIVLLRSAGVLRTPDAATGAAVPNDADFGSTVIHTRMLNDRGRTEAFIAGVRKVVREGDVVLEIGTGTGVLAVAAARAGARRVYAVEASAIADVAQATFERNGVADRVTLIRGWSTGIELPERADVLVSEIIGDDPFGESVIEVTQDARERLLKDNPRLVPDGVEAYALPLVIPQSELDKASPGAACLADWRAWYGIDFAAMTSASKNNPYSLFSIKPQHARHWPAPGPPVRLGRVNLGSASWLPQAQTATWTATSSGTLNGVLLYFEIEVAPGFRYSTQPAQAGESNHWHSPVWHLDPPVAVHAGASLELHYTPGFCGGASQLRVVSPR